MSNNRKAPCQFDDDLVLQQLRYTDMVRTVKIRTAGYSVRMTFEVHVTACTCVHVHSALHVQYMNCCVQNPGMCVHTCIYMYRSYIYRSLLHVYMYICSTVALLDIVRVPSWNSWHKCFLDSSVKIVV